MLECQSVSPWLVWTLTFVVLCGHCPTFGEKCTSYLIAGTDRGCACKTESGFVVDLRHVKCDHNDQVPCFREHKATTPGDDAVYSYDPCKKFTSGGCIDGMICQKKGDYFRVGNPDTAKFEGDFPDSLSIKYDGDPKDEKPRTSEVKLKCDNGKNKFEAIGEISSMNYTFVLTSSAVCRSIHKGGLSTGSILCILLLVFSVIYLVGGVLFLHFARGAQGVEMVPNYEFWKDLPSLVKDGALFSINGCKSDRTYQQI